MKNPRDDTSSFHVYAAHLLKRVPILDHFDRPIPAHLEQFCFPEDKEKMEAEMNAIVDDSKTAYPSKIISFVSTGRKGRPLYGVCLQIFRHEELDGR